MSFSINLKLLIDICPSSSIDRAVSVLFPLQSRKYCRPRVAHTIVWILIVILTLFNSHLLYGFVILTVKSESSPPFRMCYHRYDSKIYREFFSIYDSYVDAIKTNAIPFIIMSICNTIIIIRVCRSNSSLQVQGQMRCRKLKKKIEKERQLTLMLVGSVMAFLFLTLPTEINDIIRTHSNEKIVTEEAYLLSAILSALAHLNYAVRTNERFSSTEFFPLLFVGPFLYLYINW